MNKKVKTSVYESVAKICDELGSELNIKYDENAKDLIGELVSKKLLQYGSDLEAFMKHGKRATINVDDVKLLVRNNESLKELVDEKSKNKSSPNEDKPKGKAAKPEVSKAKKRKIGQVADETEVIALE